MMIDTINTVDEQSQTDSLLIDLKAPQPVVFHNAIFFWDQTFGDTQALKDKVQKWRLSDEGSSRFSTFEQTSEVLLY